MDLNAGGIAKPTIGLRIGIFALKFFVLLHLFSRSNFLLYLYLSPGLVLFPSTHCPSCQELEVSASRANGSYQ